MTNSSGSFDVNSFLKLTLVDTPTNVQPITAGGDAMLDERRNRRRPRFSNERRRTQQSPTQVLHQMHQQSADPFLPAAVVDSRQLPRTVHANIPVMTLANNRTLVIVEGSDMAVSTSRTSIASEFPFCRICHLQSNTDANPLIAPCRCAGTMQFVHVACLVHWLEICSRKMCPTPQCELCGYYYKTHACFKLKQLHLPRCSAVDRMLHLVFIIVLLVMLGCATICFVYLQQDPGGLRYRSSASMNYEDVIVVGSSILFFSSFFVAVFTQYRAEASLCRIAFRCYLTNRNWRIRNYNPNDEEVFKPHSPSLKRYPVPTQPPVPV